MRELLKKLQAKSVEELRRICDSVSETNNNTDLLDSLDLARKLTDTGWRVGSVWVFVIFIPSFSQEVSLRKMLGLCHRLSKWEFMLVPSWHNCSALEHLFVLFYFWTKVHSFIHSHKVYWELWWLITNYWYNHFRIKRFIVVWSFFIVYRIIKTITNHSWLLLLLEAVTMPPPWLILHFFFVSCFIVPGRSRRHGHLMSPWTELCLCLSWRPTTNFHPHPPSHLRWPSTGK